MMKSIVRKFRWIAVWAISIVVLCFAVVFINPTIGEILGWSGTVVSTFIGAFIAFQFNAERAKRDREDKEVAAGNLALVTLIEFLDRTRQHKEDYIDPVKERTSAWFDMRHGQPLDVIEFNIDKNSLSFLLDKSPMVWRSVVLEERRYQLLSKIINDHTKRLAEDVLPKLEKAGMKHGESKTEQEVFEIIGPSAENSLRIYSSFIIGAVEANSATITSCIADLRAELLKRFPSRKFVAIPTRLVRKGPDPNLDPRTE